MFDENSVLKRLAIANNAQYTHSVHKPYANEVAVPQSTYCKIMYAN